MSLALPNRELWTPTLHRLGLLRRLMAHLKRSASTGHLLRNSDGHLLNDCGSSDPVECDACSTAPGEFEVAFSGLTMCNCTSHPLILREQRGNPNETWNIPFSGTPGPTSPCVWTGFGTNTFERWNCSTSLKEAGPATHVSTLIISPGASSSLIYTLISGGTDGLFQGFLTTSSGDADCTATRVLTNSTTCTGGTGGAVGGTCTITAK